MLFKYISLRWKALFRVCWLVTSEVISECYSPLSSQRGKHVKNSISNHFSLQWLTEKTNHFIHIIRSHVIGYIAPEDDLWQRTCTRITLVWYVHSLIWISQVVSKGKKKYEILWSPFYFRSCLYLWTAQVQWNLKWQWNGGMEIIRSQSLMSLFI